MLLSDLEGATRLDLYDPPGPNQRWQTADLDRGIDKAVERYSQYYPNINWADMAMQPYQRTYPYPTPANAAFPVWWIERVIAPLQVYGSQFSPPGAGMSGVASGNTGGFNNGNYLYGVTFLSQGGETTISPLTTVIVGGGSDSQINLSSIPLGPAAPAVPQAATNVVIGRNLYRSQLNGSSLTLVTTLKDNTTTSYVDTSTDATIASNPSPPALNTSGVMYWPPFERNFSEFSNLFDSEISLAAGGNMGAMGAVGSAISDMSSITKSFTLKVGIAELPIDSTPVMRIFYATKHQLDNTGSTIPEVHRDIIVLGACGYAMQAYQVPTNDNFDFQDGGLRDRVDDTKIPASWLAATSAKLTEFEKRLQEIKQQRDFASSARVHWGDIAAFYPRL